MSYQFILLLWIPGAGRDSGYPVCTWNGNHSASHRCQCKYDRFCETVPGDYCNRAPFIMFSTAFANILRGEGASRESMVGNLLGTVVNIILDPIMILVLGWGVTGAALATLSAILRPVFTILLIIYGENRHCRFISVILRWEMESFPAWQGSVFRHP